jgi:hypothetical protein
VVFRLLVPALLLEEGELDAAEPLEVPLDDEPLEVEEPEVEVLVDEDDVPLLSVPVPSTLEAASGFQSSTPTVPRMVAVMTTGERFMRTS